MRIGGLRRDDDRSGSRADAPAGLTAAGRAAWLAFVPATLLTLATIVLLGPPLAALAFPSRPPAYWPELRQQGLVRPEGTEHARYLIALAAPLVLVALTWLLLRRPRPPTAEAAQRDARLASAAEWAGVAALGACLVAQWTYTFHTAGRPDLHAARYFTVPTLLVAAALAGAVALAAGAPRARARWAAWTADSRGRTAAAWGMAAVAVAIALLPAVQTDGGIAAGNNFILYHVQFPFDETAAVLDGRSPLGDFATQYSALWPYVLASGMSLLGSSLTVFTAQLAVLAAATLLALFDLLRRVTRSALAALALFLPLLATSAFRLDGSGADRFTLASYYGTLPLRYGGPFLLAWLLARQLDRARDGRSARPWPLFLAAGLIVLNNADFGLAALAALCAALVTVRDPRAQTLPALAREAAAGLAGALALVVALLLVRTGSLPHLSLLVRYARVFSQGFSLLPIRPVVGLSTAIYLTYVGAIGVAAVRALEGGRERLLTGLLMWSGVFGLGAGVYYVGESGPERLIQQFPSWALALALLTVVAVRRLARRPGGRPRPAELACLFGMGLLACSLAQLPAPWSQLERLGRHGHPQLVSHPVGARFVARQTRPGEPVLVLTTLGHRIADEAGVEDVEPYTGTLSIQTREQLADSVDALRAAGGRKLFVLAQYAWGSQLRALRTTFGFVPKTEEPAARFQMWVSR